MKSKRYGRGVLTVVACLGLLGCEHLRGQVRKDGDEPPPDKSEAADLKVPGVPSWAHGTGGRSGAWSSQARAIERDFNFQ